MRKSLKTILLLLLALLSLAALGLLLLAWRPLGHAPDAKLQEKMRASAQYAEGKFHNPQPLFNDFGLSVSELLDVPAHASPNEPIQTFQPELQALRQVSERLRVTWLGHSTILLELDGHRFLIDPVLGNAASPFQQLGPTRWYAPPISLEELRSLGKIDAIVLSHDHYDHLDEVAISALADLDTRFIAPLGVGAHLKYWGVAEEKIEHVDWWDELQFEDLRLMVTPARHASGRQLFDQNRTLWASYAFLGKSERAFYSGDTGFFDELSTIGERFGPFDLVMVEVGAYNQAWPDWHMGPEQAVLAHQRLRGKLFLPVHWGLLELAPHNWTEPVERVLLEAAARKVDVLTPRPGESFFADAPPAPQVWWPRLPFESKEETPIVATRAGQKDDRYPAP